MFKSNILEISKRANRGGRVPIKIALLKIHDDPTETNKNGLHWKEEYVLNAIESVKMMPICATFCDDTKTVPLDHGLTDTIVNDDGIEEPVFEDSETVGVMENGYIDTVDINGVETKVLVGQGYLFNQRYPNFVKWVRKNFALNKVETSIEIMGTPENNNQIIYEENEPTKDMRSPMEMLFSGTAILSVEPADDNAIVLEVAQKNNKEEKPKMEFTEEMKLAINSAVTTTINELNNKESEFNGKIEELNSTIVEKDAVIAQKDVELNEKETTISELNASVEQLQAALDQLKAEHETYWAERDLLEKELVKAKVEKKLGELSSAIGEFSEAEQSACKEDIDACKTKIETCEKTEDVESMTSEINSLVAKIYQEIGKAKKQADAEAVIAEQNAAMEQKEEMVDIFSEVCSEEVTEDEEDEDLNIF